MQDEYRDSSMDNHIDDPMVMTKNSHTKSYRYLWRYALPYTLLYVFLPSMISKLGLPVSGIILSVVVILILNIAVIALFKKSESRGLENIETHRIGLLTAVVTLIVTSVLMLHSLYDLSASELTLTALKENGVIPMLVISGAIGLAINYVVIAYGIRLLQKLWPNFNKIC